MQVMFASDATHLTLHPLRQSASSARINLKFLNRPRTYASASLDTVPLRAAAFDGGTLIPEPSRIRGPKRF